MNQTQIVPTEREDLDHLCAGMIETAKDSAFAEIVMLFLGKKSEPIVLMQEVED